MKEFSLKEIERRSYRSTFQDGFWDIFLGLIMIGIGLSPLLADIGLTRPWNIFMLVLPPALIFWAGKKYVTVPRLGYVKFSLKRKENKKKMILVSSIFIVITFVLVLLTLIRTFKPGWVIIPGRYFGPLLISFLVFGIPLSFIAYFLDFPRLYVIAVLFSVSWPLAELLTDITGAPLDGILSFGVSGSIVLMNGLIIFRRFVRDYPKRTGEVINGEV
jgi:hypothetical protein